MFEEEEKIVFANKKIDKVKYKTKLKILINLLLFQDDLSAWFWLFPFVLWEIIYSDQVCAGTTTSILYPRQQNLFPQNQKIFPSRIGKSSERGNLRNPVRAELQIRWKKSWQIRQRTKHGCHLLLQNWNYIGRSIFSKKWKKNYSWPSLVWR